MQQIGRRRRVGVAAIVALMGSVIVGVQVAGAADPAIISNGTVQLGVNPTAELNVPGDPSAGGVPYVGLRYVPTNNESTSPGCLCEGWGAADATTGVTGYANQDGGTGGTANLEVESFVTTATTATSVVRIKNGASADVLRVTHAYRPSATPNLYEVLVTIQNLSGATVDPRYRRVMDWDIEPTPFNEFSTIAGTAGAANVTFASDDGFASSNPLAGPSQINFTGDAVANGPDDHGALFDFKFASLAAGESVTFRTFYGAAPNEAAAKAALGVVGAEVYSFGQPSTTAGTVTDVPNTFIFGFAGVGGVAQIPAAKFLVASSSVSESAGTATITVELTAPTDAPVTIDYATSDGTATAGSDYTATSGTLTFPAGVTTKTFTVPITSDTTPEPDETVTLKLSNPGAGLVLGSPAEATLTILDDDSGGTTTTTSSTTSTTSTSTTSTSTTSTSTTSTSTSTTSTSVPSSSSIPSSTVPPTACAADRELKVADNIWRWGAEPLDGARVGRRYRERFVSIFLAPTWKPIDQLKGVDFALDGSPVRTERYVPYDLAGTRWWLSARMLDTSDLNDGTHTVTATIRTKGEPPCTILASFKVDNSKRRISRSHSSDAPEWRDGSLSRS